MSNQDFINEVGSLAVDNYSNSKVNPSAVIAQAILESNWGKSELATQANNHFGIKDKPEWEGDIYVKGTWEVIKGKDETVEAAFRAYDSLEHSVKDHGSFLTSGWRKDHYKAYGVTNWRQAILNIASGGYATDPNYASKLTNIVEKNNLTNWDEKVGIETSDEIQWTDLLVAAGAGHGLYTAGKRTPADEREWSFNTVVVESIIKELTKYGIRTVRVDDPTGKRDVPLGERTDKANAAGADIYISVHHNAIYGYWANHSGTEVFSYPGTVQGGQLARKLSPKIANVYGIQNRGAKEANFYVLRKSVMPSALTEGGFMDSRIDIVPMRNNDILRESGRDIAKIVAEHLGASKQTDSSPVSTSEPVLSTPSTSVDTLYRVQTGAFSRLDKAGQLVYQLESKGFDTYMVEADGLIKVQAGAYSTKANAEAQTDKLENAGFDTFITTKGGTAVADAEPQDDPVDSAIQYVVQNGDTLSEIAAYFGTSVDNVVQQNNIKNPDLITPGQKLYISGVSGSPNGGGSSKSISQLADEVENGLHGNGEERKKSLGSKYGAVQAEINKRYGGSSSGNNFNVESIAQQIRKGIDNKGQKVPKGHTARRKHFSLTQSQYAKVRNRVNQIM